MVGRGAGREAVSRSASCAQRRHSHCAQFKIGCVRYSNHLVGGAAPATAYTRELRLRELCPRPFRGTCGRTETTCLRRVVEPTSWRWLMQEPQLTLGAAARNGDWDSLRGRHFAHALRLLRPRGAKGGRQTRSRAGSPLRLAVCVPSSCMYQYRQPLAASMGPVTNASRGLSLRRRRQEHQN